MSLRYDMHSHLDFANDCKRVASEVQGEISTINSTVTPAAYVSAKEKFAEFPDVHVALGLHPWWAANGRISEVDISHFEELLQVTDLVGEIGLDFHKSRRESVGFQTHVFERILDSIAHSEEPKLVFLHAVKSYDKMLSLLENSGALQKSTFVFHWFQGSHEEFGRALSMGCYFSVGLRMLAKEGGELFAKAIPSEALLAETDNPSHEGMEWSAGEWKQELGNTITSLAQIRGVEVGEMETVLAENSSRLLQEFNGIDAIA